MADGAKPVAGLRRTQEDRVLTLVLDRPDKKNALTEAMYQGLADALAEADADPALRCVVITGGPDCFTSGNDLNDFLKSPPKAGGSPAVGAFMENLAAAQKPVIAAVNGVAVGIGVTLLLHCDLVYASRGARFKMPFVNIGIVQEFGSSRLLPALMGHRRAAELLMLGEMFDAATAQHYGLLNAVDENDAMILARVAARRLAGQPPAALRECKRLLKATDREAVTTMMQAEAECFVPMVSGPEALEAMTAFFEKRKPDFSRF